MKNNRVMEISLNNIISNRVYDPTIENGVAWRELTQGEKIEALTEIKKYLLEYTREGSKANKAIKSMIISNLPSNYSILDRVLYIPSQKRVDFCAAQDMTEDIKRIKNIIIKECY